jgi:hypothetical protein
MRPGVDRAGRCPVSQSVGGGYQLLWLDGVALASQQPSVNPPPVLGPATSVATTGDLFYNGAFVGLEYRR